MFGPELIKTDIQQRNIGYLQTGKMNKKHTDPNTLKHLQAYADGINSYAKSVKMLPCEFYLLWLDWQDWTVEDTIASVTFISFSL